MNGKTYKILSLLAHTPLTLAELERLEHAAIVTVMVLGSDSLISEAAKRTLRMAAEIRRARGILDSDPRAAS